jgi:hypothetical protein
VQLTRGFPSSFSDFSNLPHFGLINFQHITKYYLRKLSLQVFQWFAFLTSAIRNICQVFPQDAGTVTKRATEGQNEAHGTNEHLFFFFLLYMQPSFPSDLQRQAFSDHQRNMRVLFTYQQQKLKEKLQTKINAMVQPPHLAAQPQHPQCYSPQSHTAAPSKTNSHGAPVQQESELTLAETNLDDGILGNTHGPGTTKKLRRVADYNILRELGAGTFGKVKLGQHVVNKQYVSRIIK